MKNTLIALLIILFVGAFFRLIFLGKIPLGFFCDEASVGYNAYSILTTGKDEWGVSYPLFFRAFGEYKNPVFTYSAVPFIAAFGLNEAAVRLTSVFYGLLAVVAAFFLFKYLFNLKIAFLTALLLSLSPWLVSISRVSLEGITAMVFFTLLGTYFWFKFLDRGKFFPELFLSILFFALALYSYFPARIFIPLFVISLVLLNLKYIISKSKVLISAIAMTLILLAPLASHTLNGEGLSRWNQVKGDLSFDHLLSKYFQYLSPDFLFIKGDIDMPGAFITRHSYRGLGEAYLFQLPFFLYGLYLAFKNHSSKKYLVFLIWLLLFPLTDLLTSDASPQATRSLIGVIPLCFFSALGIYHFLNLSRKNYYHLLASVLIVCLFVQSSLSLYQAIKTSPQYSSDFWGWQYGARPVMEYFLANHFNYDQMCLEGAFNAPDIFLKFYDPKNLCQGKCQLCDLNAQDSSKKQLFAVTPDTLNRLSLSPHKFIPQKTIFYPNGKEAFIIGKTQ